MTTSRWQLHKDRAGEADILAHLRRCNARFVPPLSERVDLAAYAHRLHMRASHFEAWADDTLIGLVAAYFDGVDNAAFISNISVEENFLGYGIASTLLAQAVTHADMLGLACIRLHVGISNTAARRLYEKHGFHACPDVGEQILMQLDLPGTTR
jgi:ribosomal protein S18 acetylase RimI-like enzyme